MAASIAAGNNNAAGLTAWTAIAPSGTTDYLREPYIDGGYIPGEEQIKADGTSYHAGFPTITLTFSYMLYSQLEHLRTTYCGGGWTGKVTLRTKLTKGGSEANYNAIMRLPFPSESNEQIGRVDTYQIQFTRLEAL